MMELLRSWLTGITAAAMIAAMADSLIPEGSIRKIGKLTGGLLLLLVVLRPLGELKSIDMSEILLDYRIQSEAYAAGLESENARLIKSIIEEETAAYIQDKATGMGIECRAQVTCSTDADGISAPESAAISGALTQEQIQRLSRLIEEELAIPAENQKYEGAEGRE